MQLQISKEGSFIPELNGNKGLVSTDQIIVKYRNPTVAIKNRCRRKPKMKGISDSKGNMENMEIVIEKDELATLNEMLISISGCSYNDAERENAIATAKDLINAPVAFEPLLKEIVAEFDRVLDNVEISEKN